MLLRAVWLGVPLHDEKCFLIGEKIIDEFSWASELIIAVGSLARHSIEARGSCTFASGALPLALFSVSKDNSALKRENHCFSIITKLSASFKQSNRWAKSLCQAKQSKIVVLIDFCVISAKKQATKAHLQIFVTIFTLSDGSHCFCVTLHRDRKSN